MHKLTQFLSIAVLFSLPLQAATSSEKNLKDLALCEELLKSSQSQADFQKAFEACQKAAIAGHPAAQLHLGVMYKNGEGVPKSEDSALQWYLKAAEQNFGPAPSYASEILFKRGGKADLEKAKSLLQVRLWQADDYDMQLYAKVLVATATSPSDYKEAIDIWKKFLEKETGKAAFYIGLIYDRHLGKEKGSYAEAIKFYVKSADLGSPEAATNLSRLYHDGLGTEPNEELMMKYLLIGAEGGSPIAHWRLGDLYHGGDHPKVAPKDYAKALVHLNKAADAGFKEALELLKEMYEQGQGVPKDKAKVKELADRIAKIEKSPML